MGRPRKVVELPPVAPGPDMLELRYGRRGAMAKIVFAQRVHSYSLDTSDPTKVVITGVVRLSEPPKTVAAPEPPQPVEEASDDVVGVEE